MIGLDTLTGSKSTRIITDRKGNFSVLEYTKTSGYAATNPSNAYYYSQLGIRKKQAVVELNGNSVVLQSGAMQMMLGNVNAETNVQGVGDLFKKALSSKVTGESAIKPKYSGSGFIVLEPTWKYIILEDLAD